MKGDKDLKGIELLFKEAQRLGIPGIRKSDSIREVCKTHDLPIKEHKMTVNEEKALELARDIRNTMEEQRKLVESFISVVSPPVKPLEYYWEKFIEVLVGLERNLQDIEMNQCSSSAKESICARSYMEALMKLRSLREKVDKDYPIKGHFLNEIIKGNAEYLKKFFHSDSSVRENMEGNKKGV
jgi:hypothetical protein